MAKRHIESIDMCEELSQARLVYRIRRPASFGSVAIDGEPPKLTNPAGVEGLMPIRLPEVAEMAATSIQFWRRADAPQLR